MKKRNIVGHMMMPKESAGGWFRRWQILPRLICLIVAVLLWLLIVNVTALKAEAAVCDEAPVAVATEDIECRLR